MTLNRYRLYIRKTSDAASYNKLLGSGRYMILAVGNMKGGVGKTTLAVDLAIALSRQGRDVLLIDGDEQGTAMAFTELRSAQKSGKPGYTAVALHGKVIRDQTGSSLPSTRISWSMSAAGIRVVFGRRLPWRRRSSFPCNRAASMSGVSIRPRSLYVMRGSQ